MKRSNIGSLQIRALIILLLALVLSACNEPPKEQAELVRSVKLLTITGDDSNLTLEFPGVIDAALSVNIGFEVPGKIIELPIKEGQKIEKGMLLAKLDDTDYLAARNAAKSNHYALNSVYQRAKKIFDLGAGSQAEIDIALRDVKVARDELTRAQKALNDTTLTSPFNGEVGRKIADNYQNMQAKQPVVLIQDISTLEINVSIPERDFIQMDTNLSAEQRTVLIKPEVELSSIPDRRFPAYFKSFTSAADPITRTYTVTLGFENPKDVTILPGMTAKAVITVNGKNNKKLDSAGVMVPVSSIVGDEKGNSFAWVVDQDTMQVSKVLVNIGTMLGAEIQVLKGLKAGDQIVISGVNYLREGVKVRPLIME